MQDHVRVKEFVSVLLETELVVAQDWRSGDDAVRAGTQIFLESRQQNFRGFAAAADHCPTLQDQYALARLGQICCADEAVMTRSGEYIVETIRARRATSCRAESWARLLRSADVNQPSHRSRHKRRRPQEIASRGGCHTRVLRLGSLS